jgi:hypothetical protein
VASLYIRDSLLIRTWRKLCAMIGNSRFAACLAHVNIVGRTTMVIIPSCTSCSLQLPILKGVKSHCSAKMPKSPSGNMRASCHPQFPQLGYSDQLYEAIIGKVAAEIEV